MDKYLIIVCVTEILSGVLTLVRGEMTLNSTKACMANATQCLNQVYDRLGFNHNDLVTLFLQTTDLTKGNVVRPWNETCSGSEAIFTTAAFDCFERKTALCSEGLMTHIGLPTEFVTSTMNLYRHYCSAGCEDIKTRLVKQMKCLENVPEPPVQNLTNSDKSTICSDTRAAVNCSVLAGEGCGFTQARIRMDLPGMQAQVSAKTKPMSCKLELPSNGTASAAGQMTTASTVKTTVKTTVNTTGTGSSTAKKTTTEIPKNVTTVNTTVNTTGTGSSTAKKTTTEMPKNATSAACTSHMEIVMFTPILTLGIILKAISL